MVVRSDSISSQVSFKPLYQMVIKEMIGDVCFIYVTVLSSPQITRINTDILI